MLCVKSKPVEFGQRLRQEPAGAGPGRAGQEAPRAAPCQPGLCGPAVPVMPPAPCGLAPCHLLCVLESGVIRKRRWKVCEGGGALDAKVLRNARGE